MSIGGGDAALSPGLSVTCSEAELLTWMKILPGMSRPTEAAPADVVIFLKSSLWLLLSLRRAPDENLDLWIERWRRFGVVSFMKAPPMLFPSPPICSW